MESLMIMVFSIINDQIMGMSVTDEHGPTVILYLPDILVTS